MRIISLSVVAASIGLVACGGTTTIRGTLPDAERATMALLPNDAFLVGRIDGAAIRATPTWRDVEDDIDEAYGPQMSTILRGTDHVYFAVGGLVDAPPVPPQYDEQGTYRSRPAWADVASAFRGRVPAVVAILEGEAASFCRVALSQVETHETSGFRHGAKDGVAIATQGDRLCAVTLEPVLPHLLSEQGPESPVLDRLGAIDVDGDLGLVTGVFALDAPSFRALVEGAGPIEPDANDEQIVAFAKRLFGIFSTGVDAVHWQATRTATGYASRSRVEMSDADRSTMWREISEMYIEGIRAFVDSGIGDREAREVARTIIEGTRIEQLEDGYRVVTGLTDAHVAAFVDAMIPEQHVLEVGEQAVAIDAEESALEGTAAETIARLESEIDARIGSVAGRATLAELAQAYASVGRFDDARRLLHRLVDATREEPSFGALYGGNLCELELVSGHPAEALAAANAAIEVCASTYCGSAQTEVASCRFVARAMSGDADALAELDRSGNMSSYDGSGTFFGGTRARVLFAVGRYAEAAASARAVCPGPSLAPGCDVYARIEVEALARGTGPLDAVREALDRARSFDPGSASARVQQASSVWAAEVECIARVMREPATEETRDACAAALTASETTHGATHPTTGTIAAFLARALTAARDTRGAAAALAKANAALATLGPTHPLRADVEAVSARPARRR